MSKWVKADNEEVSLRFDVNKLCDNVVAFAKSIKTMIHPEWKNYSGASANIDEIKKDCEELLIKIETMNRLPKK